MINVTGATGLEVALTIQPTSGVGVVTGLGGANGTVAVQR